MVVVSDIVRNGIRKKAAALFLAVSLSLGTAVCADPWLPPAGFASTGKFRKFHSELAQTFDYQRVMPLFPFVLPLFGAPIRYVSSAKYRKKNRSVQRLRL